MFGKLETAEIDELIRGQLVGRIGCHADNITYVVPVSYVYDDNYIYVHTNNGMKIEMMRKNPNVCFQTDDSRNLAYWQSAVCWGEFEELIESTEKKLAWEKLHGRVLPILSSETMHISKDWPFMREYEELIPGIFFRIRLTRKTGRFEMISGQDFFAT